MPPEQPREFAYRVDATDRIVHVDTDWLAFASENHADLGVDVVVGRSLWDFIAGMETRSLYRALLGNVRRSGRAVAIPFRCDSPGTRRFMELDLRPRSGGGPAGEVDLVGRLLREEPRMYLAVLDSQLTRARNRIEICSFCKKVFAPGAGWLELERALPCLEVFSREEPPRLEHSLCEDCASEQAAHIGATAA